MNKISLLFLGLSALVLTTMGCSDSESEYDPGIVFSKTGDVTFVASIENCRSRATLVNTGEARWVADDAIGMVCTDGLVVTLPLDGTGETRRAMFSGTIPSGKEVGSYAVHPANAVCDGGVMTVELPAETQCVSTASCAVMVAEVAESYNIFFRQLMSYANIRFDNINPDMYKIVLSSEKALSGSYSVALADALTGELAAKEGEGNLDIILPDKKNESVSTTFAIPAGEYASLVATAYNADGKELCSTECLASPMRAERGVIRQLTIAMPDVSNKKEPIEGTVLVAGIYWAPGNLQHFEGAAETGFQPDWRFAPEQWQYVNSENAAAVNKAVTFKATDYKECDHFNWGGIASPFDCEATSCATAAVGTDISGRMFTSQDCTVPTTDFSAARFGDLAFWATKGRFRLPTSAEITKLLKDASCQYASYKVANGKFVTGLYFFDPEEGDAPTVSDEVKEITADDLKNGLFLPKAGRRYNTQPLTINVQGTQGVYWLAEAITGDDANQPCYGGVLSIQNAVYKYPYWNKAFDAKAGFSIRPVYIE